MYSYRSSLRLFTISLCSTSLQALWLFQVETILRRSMKAHGLSLGRMIRHICGIRSLRVVQTCHARTFTVNHQSIDNSRTHHQNRNPSDRNKYTERAQSSSDPSLFIKQAEAIANVLPPETKVELDEIVQTAPTTKFSDTYLQDCT